MIKPGKNRKKCKIDGCDAYVFSKGLCKYHYQIEYAKSYKPKKNTKILVTKKIKPISEKTIERNQKYKQAKNNVREKLIQAKQWKCFFSNKPLPLDYNRFHHLEGRVGNLYFDENNIVPALDEYHLKYHDLPVEKLQKEWWYEIFLENLKKKNIKLYEKEINKLNK